MNIDIVKKVMESGFKVNALRTNALLRDDEWKQVDAAVIPTIKENLVGIADLYSYGLTKDLGGIGTMISEWDAISDMDGATMNMSGYTKPTNGDIAFTSFGVPVPMFMKNFYLNTRRLEAARRNGTGLDTEGASAAGRVVAELMENTLFNGATLKVDGYSLYGYTTFPARNKITVNGDWETTANIMPDVNETLAAADAEGVKGPFILYVPSDWMSALREDYNATAGKTFMQRILQNPEIVAVKRSDRLASDNAVLVQMSRQTVDLAIGQAPTTLMWEAEGSFMVNFLAFACLAPRLKQDYNGKCGIFHLAKSH